MYSLAPDASLEPTTPPSIDQPQDRSKLLYEDATPRTALLGQPPSADLQSLKPLWPADQVLRILPHQSLRRDSHLACCHERALDAPAIGSLAQR